MEAVVAWKPSLANLATQFANGDAVTWTRDDDAEKYAAELRRLVAQLQAWRPR